MLVKVLIGIGVTLVVGAALVFVLVAAAFSGGVDNLFAGQGPDEDTPEVVRARERAQPKTLAALDGLTSTVREVVRPHARVIGAPTTTSECERGQHNWKRDDPFDLRCLWTASTVVAGDLAAFRSQMLALHERLVADGWTPDPGGIAEAIFEYWDAYNGPFPDSPSGDGEYTPADLPFERYRQPDTSLELEIRWTDVGPGEYGIILELRRLYFEG